MQHGSTCREHVGTGTSSWDFMELRDVCGNWCFTDIAWSQTLWFESRKRTITHKTAQHCRTELCQRTWNEACWMLAAHSLVKWNQNKTTLDQMESSVFDVDQARINTVTVSGRMWNMEAGVWCDVAAQVKKVCGWQHLKIAPYGYMCKSWCRKKADSVSRRFLRREVSNMTLKPNTDFAKKRKVKLVTWAKNVPLHSPLEGFKNKK